MNARGERHWLTAHLTPAGERLVRATLLANGPVGRRYRSLVEGLIVSVGVYVQHYGPFPPLSELVRGDVQAALVDALDGEMGEPKRSFLTQDDLHPQVPIGGPRTRSLPLPLRDPADRGRVVALLAGAEQPTPDLLGRALTAMCLAVVLADEHLLRCWAADYLDALYEETYGPDQEWPAAMHGNRDAVKTAEAAIAPGTSAGGPPTSRVGERGPGGDRR